MNKKQNKPSSPKGKLFRAVEKMGNCLVPGSLARPEPSPELYRRAISRLETELEDAAWALRGLVGFGPPKNGDKAWEFALEFLVIYDRQRVGRE